MNRQLTRGELATLYHLKGYRLALARCEARLRDRGWRESWIRETMRPLHESARARASECDARHDAAEGEGGVMFLEVWTREDAAEPECLGVALSHHGGWISYIRPDGMIDEAHVSHVRVRPGTRTAAQMFERRGCFYCAAAREEGRKAERAEIVEHIEATMSRFYPAKMGFAALRALSKIADWIKAR